MMVRHILSRRINILLFEIHTYRDQERLSDLPTQYMGVPYDAVSLECAAPFHRSEL